MEEQWKVIEGFEGIYEISNLGRLKSFKKDKMGYILSNKNSKGNYLSVVLEYKNKKRCAKMHRLVAEAFIPNPYNFPQVNHIDMNRQNNRTDNLEWCTRKYNIHHAIENNGNMLKGIKKYNKYIRPKQIYQYSLDNELMAIYPNAKLAEKITGVCGRNILQVASKDEYKPGLTRKQAGGFKWSFKEVI